MKLSNASNTETVKWCQQELCFDLPSVSECHCGSPSNVLVCQLNYAINCPLCSVYVEYCVCCYYTIYHVFVFL